MLLRGLPHDSATATAVAPHLAGYTHEAELLATIAELIHSLGLVQIEAAGAKWKGPRPKPLQVPRPWVQPKPKRQASTTELVSLFGLPNQGGD